MARKDVKTKKKGWKQLKAPKTPTASIKLKSNLSGPLYFVDSKGDGSAKKPVKKEKKTKEVKRASTSLSHNERPDCLYDAWATPSAENPTPSLNEWTRDIIAPAKQTRSRSSLLSEPLLAGSFSNSEVCHPGQSYNPSAADRSKAVEVALEFCMKADKDAIALENKLAEAKKAVFLEEEALGTDNDDDSVVGVSRSITRAEDRRTQVQKNKRKRHLLEVRESVKRKSNKKLLAQIDSAETIKKEIEQKKQDGNQISKRSKTIRFGGHRLPEAFPDVLLSDEVGRGLQEFEARPGILRDRFIRLQRKGLIATRKTTTKTNKKKLIFRNCGRGVQS